MSTRSYIGYVRDDGTVQAIYCHNSGYLEGVGKTLFECYTAEEKVFELLGLGDISSLKEGLSPRPGEKHSFDAPCPGITIAYHRDRGEDWEMNKPSTFENVAALLDSALKGMCEYVYLFEFPLRISSCWRCYELSTDPPKSYYLKASSFDE